MRKSALCLCAVVSLSCAAFADAGEVVNAADVFSGKLAPLTVKFKELKGDWVRLKVMDPADAVGALMGVVAGFLEKKGLGNSDMPLVLSQGRTVNLAGEAYLLVYHRIPRIPASLLDELDEPEVAAFLKPVTEESLNGNTELHLSLVHLKSAGSLMDLRPYNPAAELKAQEAAAAKALETSQANLKKIIAAFRKRAENGQPLPTYVDADLLAMDLAGDGVKVDDFNDPRTGKAYGLNMLLSGRKLVHLGDPAKWVVFYEERPAADGLRAVALLDGTVKRVGEDDWKAMRKLSRLDEEPDSGPTFIPSPPPPPAHSGPAPKAGKKPRKR